MGTCMEPNTPLKFTNAGEAVSQLREMVMAWAVDGETGRATYILELDATRSGAKSGCICHGCGEPMIAVNNAKETVKRRPHFRHHVGAGERGCSVIAARAAVLRTLQDLGWIDLPARTCTGRVTGLDGFTYESTASKPGQRVRIRDIEFEDRVTAMLHMDDGRQIRVTLKGTVNPLATSDASIAEIHIEVDDPEVALMDPATLRDRLSLSNVICWHRHWDDDELQGTANDQAQAVAAEHLAVAPDDLPLPPDMPPELKVETVLHYAVKLILQEAGELRTPSESIYVEAESRRQMHSRSWMLPTQNLILHNIELEKRLGLTRPDLICDAVDVLGGKGYMPMCIEVTVTNRIDSERRSRIMKVGLAALEIDLSRFGGRITRTELRNLVVQNLDCKSWLFNPWVSEKWHELRLEVEALKDGDDEAIELEEAERAEIEGCSIAVLATEHLDAVQAHLNTLTHASGDHGALPDQQSMAATREAVAATARRLAIKGYPGADDEYLLDQRGILGVLLALRNDRALGGNLNSGFQVLNAMMNGRGTLHSLAPLWLAAARAFRLPMSEMQEQIFDGWAAKVRAQILSVPRAYTRRETFDSLLVVLFPELEEALRKTTARHLAGQFEKTQQRTSRPAGPRTKSDAKVSGPKWLQDTDSRNMYLRGPELEAWIRDHPKAAADLGLAPKK